MSELAIKQTFSLAPQNLDEALKFADYLANSDIVPKDFQRKPANILVAVQWGMELGLQPMQAMQSIAVINGRPSLWGDAVIALVRSSPLCEYVYETDDGETASCRVKRVGEDEQTRTFSMTDAQQAGLKGKQGPWAQYPKRMRQMRARSFALRDVFPDVLRGMPMAEEVQDIPTEPIRVVAQSSAPKIEGPAVLPSYPDESLTKNLPTWRAAIEAGRKTPKEIIETVTTKYTLTAEQADAINQLTPIEGDAE